MKKISRNKDLTVFVVFRVTSEWICTPGGTAVETFTLPCRDTRGSSGNKIKHTSLQLNMQSGLSVMRSWTLCCVCVLSDLDWSWFEPELLVTSSVDTYIYIWDTRLEKTIHHVVV